jgi:hypothetical protein
MKFIYSNIPFLIIENIEKNYRQSASADRCCAVSAYLTVESPADDNNIFYGIGIYFSINLISKKFLQLLVIHLFSIYGG